MSITIGQAEGGEDEVLSAINTTPLVDVMLVLLIIFLITIPVVTHTVPVSLPRETNQARETRPENINISVTKEGKVYWNEARMDSREDLQERLVRVAKVDPQPEVHIHGDSGARYEPVGRVVLAAQRAGIVKLGFITEPPPRN